MTRRRLGFGGLGTGAWYVRLTARPGGYSWSREYETEAVTSANTLIDGNPSVFAATDRQLFHPVFITHGLWGHIAAGVSGAGTVAR